MSPIIGIPVMIILLILKGMFSGSEIALVNADKIRLKKMANGGHKGAKLVLKAFERPDELLSTTLIGTNITTIALTTIGTLMMVQLLGKQGDLWALILFTPMFLVFGEIVPKSIFQEKSDVLTPILIYPLLAFSKVLWPIVFVFSRLAGWAARLAGGQPEQGLFVSRDQLSAVVHLAEQSGSLGSLNQGQLRQVLKFSDVRVDEIMIPLSKLVTFSKNSKIREVIAMSLETGHRRFPVYEADKTNLYGIANVTNRILLEPSMADQSIETITQQTIYVKQDQTLDQVLPLILSRQERMILVADNNCKTIGVVTFEDLISNAIGDVNIGR